MGTVSAIKTTAVPISLVCQNTTAVHPAVVMVVVAVRRHQSHHRRHQRIDHVTGKGE
jgi:hypothetical protein